MRYRPTAVELLDAVRAFLEDEVVPATGDDRLRFRARVAANAVAIAAREVAAGAAPSDADAAELAALLGVEDPRERGLSADEAAAELAAELARRIRAGEAPAAALAVAQRSVARALAVASPRYLERYDSY